MFLLLVHNDYYGQRGIIKSEILYKNMTLIYVYFSGNLGNRWRYGHVTIRSNDPYQIALEGVVGSSFQVKQNRKKKIEEFDLIDFYLG